VYSALFAFELIRYLATNNNLSEAGLPYRIGIIAPYKAQADLIDKLMASAKLPDYLSVQVGTIHGFQGDECDTVIALFNPPPSISANTEMFLNKLNIINVSISRSRDYLFLVMPDDNTENIRNLTLIKYVEKLCKKQPEWAEMYAHDIEALMLGSPSYLEDNSFSTSHQLVNVYGEPEMVYEIRSEENAIDIQVHEPAMTEQTSLPAAPVEVEEEAAVEPDWVLPESVASLAELRSLLSRLNGNELAYAEELVWLREQTETYSKQSAKTRQYVEKRFPPPEFTYFYFTTELDNCEESFIKLICKGADIIALSSGQSEQWDAKFQTIKEGVLALSTSVETLAVQLMDNYDEFFGTDSVTTKIESLVDDMRRLTESVSKYS
jgi:hypothetical protein